MLNVLVVWIVIYKLKLFSCTLVYILQFPKTTEELQLQNKKKTHLQSLVVLVQSRNKYSMSDLL